MTAATILSELVQSVQEESVMNAVPSGVAVKDAAAPDVVAPLVEAIRGQIRALLDGDLSEANPVNGAVGEVCGIVEEQRS